MFEKPLGGPGALVSQRNQRRFRTVGVYTIAFVVSVFVLVPLYMMIVTAFQSPEALFGGGGLSVIPTELSVFNFGTLINNTNTGQYFINSAIITIGVVVISTALGVVAGYGLTRFNFTGKEWLARLVLLSYMVSPIVLAIPLYIIFFKLNWLNTYIAVILAVTATAAPFSIWLMWQYFQNIPISYEESAWTRGASRWRTIWDVVLPLARPGYISVAIFAFAVAWNDYTMAKVVLSDQALYPITLGSSLFLSQPFISWGQKMAVTFLMSIPPFIVALSLQNYLLQGFDIGHQ